ASRAAWNWLELPSCGTRSTPMREAVVPERSLGVVADPPAEVAAIVRVIRSRLVGSSRVRHVPAIPARALHEAVARYGSGLVPEIRPVPEQLDLQDQRVPV